MSVSHIKLQAKKHVSKSIARSVAIISILALLVPSIATAAGSAPSTQFTDPNPQANDSFGYALSFVI